MFKKYTKPLNIDLTIFLLFPIYFTYIYIYIYIVYEHHSSITVYTDDNQLCITMTIYIFSISYLAEN